MADSVEDVRHAEIMCALRKMGARAITVTQGAVDAERALAANEPALALKILRASLDRARELT